MMNKARMEKNQFLLLSSILMVIYTVIYIAYWDWWIILPYEISFYWIIEIVGLVLPIVCILIAYERSSRKFAWVALVVIAFSSDPFSWWVVARILTVYLIYKGIEQLEGGSHKQKVQKSIEPKEHKVNTLLVAAILGFICAVLMIHLMVTYSPGSWIFVPLFWVIFVGVLSLIAYLTNNKLWAFTAIVLVVKFIIISLVIFPFLLIHSLVALTAVISWIIMGLLISSMKQLDKLEEAQVEKRMSNSSEE